MATPASSTRYAANQIPGRGNNSHTVFVGGLSDDVFEQDLVEALRPVGDVIAIKWISDKCAVLCLTLVELGWVDWTCVN